MPTVTNKVSQAGMAWIVQHDIQSMLPSYKFNLSVAVVNQSKVDATGNINVLVARLPQPDKHTRATHHIYIKDTAQQIFDETSELLITVNRKKIKNGFLLNGFFHMEAIPKEPRSVFKKLNAYTYEVREDKSFAHQQKKSGSLPLLGYAYLKVQADPDHTGEVIGKMIATSENAEVYHNLFIRKEKVLDLAGIEPDHFYILAIKNEETKNEYRLFYSSIINYQAVDYAFKINRKAFMRLGWSDNNGHVIFVAYTRDKSDVKKGDLELYYVHYNPENIVGDKTAFSSGLGWSSRNMYWLAEE